MIILGHDGRNMTLTADLLQLKMLVGVLRQVAAFPNCRQLLIDAAHRVNQDGFSVDGDDVRTAVEQAGKLIGYRTDDCVHPSKLQTQQPQVVVEEVFVPTPKESVN